MTELRQALSRFDLTMIAVGSTIGSGIFLTPSSIMSALPSPIWVMVIWIVGGMMALAGSLTFAEVSGRQPGAGGMYVYLREAYGGLAGFLFGWAYFLVVNTGGVAALCIAFATYLGYFMALTPEQIIISAIAGLTLLTAINVIGVKTGGLLADVLTITKIVGIAGLVVAGFGFGSRPMSSIAESPSVENLAGGLALGMVGVLWSYGGWQHASFASSEARNPARTVPVAMVAGACIVTVTYLLANAAYLLFLTPEEIASSPRLASDAISTVLGPTGGGIIAGLIFVSTFGSVGIYTLTAPRIYFAMARDGVLPRQVGSVHKKYQTPVGAIVLQSAWAVVLILFWGTFENLISYVVFTDWIFFGLAGGSVFVFRKRLGRPNGTFSTPLYPLTPLFFVGLSLWFVINTMIEKPQQAIAGLMFLMLGVPLYFYWARHNRH